MSRTLRFAAAAASLLWLAAPAARAGQPVMTVYPLDVSFAPLEVNLASETETITIENAPGGSDLSYDVFFEEGDTADFLLSCPKLDPTCLHGVVGPGFYREFYVSFTPTAGGQRAATVRVDGNDHVNEFDDILLSGFATDTIFKSGFEPLDPDWSECVGGTCTGT